MVFASMNRTTRVAWLIIASALCGVVVIGVSQWTDIQFELGFAYENGNFHGWTPGFTQDYRKADYWLGKAAQANHPRAQYMLGIQYSQGWGVPRNAQRAVAWFNRSAQNGYAPACYHLGWMLHKGDSVQRDNERAIKLMEQAAGQGMAAAHLALGKFYEHSEGVSADAVQALKWYTLAVHFARSRPGLFDNAAFAVRAQAAQDALAAHMNPFSEEQSQKLARQWLAKLPLNRT